MSLFHDDPMLMMVSPSRFEVTFAIGCLAKDIVIVIVHPGLPAGLVFQVDPLLVCLVRQRSRCCPSSVSRMLSPTNPLRWCLVWVISWDWVTRSTCHSFPRGCSPSLGGIGGDVAHWGCWPWSSCQAQIFPFSPHS